MYQNPDPSQPGEPAPPGYAPHSPSYYGNFSAQPGTTGYYAHPNAPQGQPMSGPYPGPVYPPGAGFPPPGYMPPPPFMNPGVPPVYPPPKKKRTWLWVLIGSAIVFLVLLLAACGVFFSSIFQLARSSSNASYSYSQQLDKQETQLASDNGGTSTSSDSTTSSDGSTSSNDSSTSSSSTDGTTSVVNVGQKLTSNGVDCTLVSVQKVDADQYAHPEAGNQLIMVHIKLENHSGQKLAYNVFDFHVISNGQVHSEFIFTPQSYTANNRLRYGDLLPGAMVEGDIFFEVPISDHQVKMSWEPIWAYSETKYEWNLGL